MRTVARAFLLCSSHAEIPFESGRFGVVYRCEEKSTGRVFAAKYVTTPKKSDRQDVEREVNIMRKLQHPRLLQLYEAYDDPGKKEMVLILELIEGGELFERVIDDDFVLTEKACSIFLRQICEGVDFMHTKNILHLDMKPENVLCLTRTGNRIKLIDFGLAREYDPKKPLHLLHGTPEFVAPEVVSYDEVGFGTDMWSVGVITYVLLSGLSPFMGENDNDTLENVRVGKYDFDDDAFDEISDEAKDFINKLLVKDKSKRMSAAECRQHIWLKPGQHKSRRRKSSAIAISRNGSLRNNPSATQRPELQPLNVIDTNSNILDAKEREGNSDEGDFSVLDVTRENLKDFVDRWNDKPNQPSIFPREPDGSGTNLGNSSPASTNGTPGPKVGENPLSDLPHNKPGAMAASSMLQWMSRVDRWLSTKNRESFESNSTNSPFGAGITTPSKKKRAHRDEIEKMIDFSEAAKRRNSLGLGSRELSVLTSFASTKVASSDVNRNHSFCDKKTTLVASRIRERHAIMKQQLDECPFGSPTKRQNPAIDNAKANTPHYNSESILYPQKSSTETSKALVQQAAINIEARGASLISAPADAAKFDESTNKWQSFGISKDPSEPQRNELGQANVNGRSSSQPEATVTSPQAESICDGSATVMGSYLGVFPSELVKNAYSSAGKASEPKLAEAGKTNEFTTSLNDASEASKRSTVGLANTAAGGTSSDQQLSMQLKRQSSYDLLKKLDEPISIEEVPAAIKGCSETSLATNGLQEATNPGCFQQKAALSDEKKLFRGEDESTTDVISEPSSASAVKKRRSIHKDGTEVPDQVSAMSVREAKYREEHKRETAKKDDILSPLKSTWTALTRNRPGRHSMFVSAKEVPTLTGKTPPGALRSIQEGAGSREVVSLRKLTQVKPNPPAEEVSLADEVLPREPVATPSTLTIIRDKPARHSAIVTRASPLSNIPTSPVQSRRNRGSSIDDISFREPVSPTQSMPGGGAIWNCNRRHSLLPGKFEPSSVDPASSFSRSGGYLLENPSRPTTTNSFSSLRNPLSGIGKLFHHSSPSSGLISTPGPSRRSQLAVVEESVKLAERQLSSIHSSFSVPSFRRSSTSKAPTFTGYAGLKPVPSSSSISSGVTKPSSAASSSPAFNLPFLLKKRST